MCGHRLGIGTEKRERTAVVYVVALVGARMSSELRNPRP